jgi:phosphoserine phosphatase RsbU/P
MLIIPSTDVIRLKSEFWSSAPAIFAGSIFIGFGLAAAALAIVRRKFDALLIYFALFASLYGLRLCLESVIVQAMLPPSVILVRLRSVLMFLMPIPAFLFFGAAGLLLRRGRLVGYLLATTGVSLTIATCITGVRSSYFLINNAVVILALIVLSLDFLRRAKPYDADFIVIRRGLLSFAALAVFDNISGALSFRLPRIEPIGFAALLASLGYIAAQRIFARDQQLAEIQNELDVARRIQVSILPPAFPSSQHFKVEARYEPMTSVAGDFYDYVSNGSNKLALLIADVSGHGVPAALIASMVKLAAAAQRMHSDEPAKFLSGMNSALLGNTQGQFVTAAYACIDASTQTLRYSAAGHPPLMLLRNRKVKEVEQNGLILAAFGSATYEDITLPLLNGDRILLYTDGLIEAASVSREFFGMERLSSLLVETAGLSLSQAADHIVTSVKKWSPFQEDDLTIILCDLALGTAPAPE